MKNLLSLLFLVLLLSCSSNERVVSCFPKFPVNVSVNLDLPDFVNLRVPGNSAYISGGHRGIVVYNVNGSDFKAFDRACPNNIQSCEPMTIQNSIQLKCSCDSLAFNILNGAPISGSSRCFAKEYRVENLNGSILRITNF